MGLLNQTPVTIARREMRRLGMACAMAICVLFPRQAKAQLAITEVMSSAAENPSLGGKNSDHWELTNFGTHPIDLRDYRFNDADHEDEDRVDLIPSGSTIFSINPGQSFVFVRSNVSTNEDQFRQWWGSCVAADTPILFYRGPGLSRYGDELTLFSSAGLTVDQVHFGRARAGTSFVYDTITGEFGVHSAPGLNGACMAETATDTGSPGTTTGPVPLRIVAQPQSTGIHPQLNVTLSVKAVGLPRPRYQWFFDGMPLPGETRATITLSNMISTMAGAYHVRVSNGLSSVLSSNALVTLLHEPSEPRIVSAPLDATVLVNKGARFTLLVSAVPLATYQWFFNGVLLPNESGRSLLIPTCGLEMSGSEVMVRATNSLGSVEARARLFVTTKLDLRITEIQAAPSTDCDDHGDWFELTNFGTNAIQLLGYRFYDKRRLASAVVIDLPILLRPMESMVFVKTSAIGSFVEWWGPENLPEGLKIFSYSGFSLNRSGETLFVWSDSAETDQELVCDRPFSGSRPGISQWFDEDTAAFGRDSVVGEMGAFLAPQCGDIGSPGYISNPWPRFLSVERGTSGTRLRWRAIANAHYEILVSPSLADPWSRLRHVISTNSLAETVDSESIQVESRFYRIQEVTP